VKGEYVYSGTGFLSAPIASVDGEYVYKGTSKMDGPIANISGGRQNECGSGSGVPVVYVGPVAPGAQVTSGDSMLRISGNNRSRRGWPLHNQRTLPVSGPDGKNPQLDASSAAVGVGN
jgi:hypothetical protein